MVRAEIPLLSGREDEDAFRRAAAGRDIRCRPVSCLHRLEPVSLTAGSSSGLDLARMIDHTILKPDATQVQVEAHCAEAVAHGFKAVCVNPVHVSLVAEALAGSGVETCSVVGFPLGAVTAADKGGETERAVRHGAREIDMVLAIGALRGGDRDGVRDDIAAVRRSCPDAVLKVIIETCLLTDDEKRLACEISAAAGADFVKTSTGFGSGGATIEDVRLMHAVVGDALGVKASGGIRTRAAALALIEAGASRIGASSGIALLTSDPPRPLGR